MHDCLAAHLRELAPGLAALVGEVGGGGRLAAHVGVHGLAPGTHGVRHGSSDPGVLTRP